MFARMIEDMKESTGLALKMASVLAAVAIALFIMLSFLCAAAFVYVLQTYGPIAACLTGAGVFLLAALIAATIYAWQKRQARRRAAQATKSALHSALSDPTLMTAALQVIRVVGVKKLVPILAVGGLALGLLANRAHSDQAPAE
jgi:hypothetical protein